MEFKIQKLLCSKCNEEIISTNQNTDGFGEFTNTFVKIEQGCMRFNSNPSGIAIVEEYIFCGHCSEEIFKFIDHSKTTKTIKYTELETNDNGEWVKTHEF